MLQRRRVIAAVTVLAALVALSLRLASRASADQLPSRVSDKDFWAMVLDFSEPSGYFRSDNFLSNELAFQHVIPELTQKLAPGGVYLGVGPEQNFTYLAALKPKMAFIVDIRRGNLHEHLLYKAFIETSSDRAEFLSKLFARPKPEGLTASASADQLLSAYRESAPSDALFARNLQAARDHLVKDHGFALLPEDLAGLEYVYKAFYQGGPGLNYTFSTFGAGPPGAGQFGGAAFGGGFFPTYADLMTATDTAGQQRSYLATEENFRIVSELERNNAIVPIVGDFGGPRAIRNVAAYLTEHGARVSAFYTSNVEMYLFQSDSWKKFYGNVATLPIDASSTFIRSVSNRGARVQNASPGFRSSTRLSSIADLLTAFRAGKVEGYYDVIALSH